MIVATALAPSTARPPARLRQLRRMLGRSVREAAALSLGDAVRMMTSPAARRLGRDDRGLLGRRRFAGVTAADPATIRDESTFESLQRIATGV